MEIMERDKFQNQKVGNFIFLSVKASEKTFFNKDTEKRINENLGGEQKKIDGGGIAPSCLPSNRCH